MIYFTSYQILISMLSFFLLGALFGGVYGCERYLFYFLKKLVLSPKSAYIKYTKQDNTAKNTKQNNKTLAFQISDFVFVFILGLCYIIFSYLFLDGSFRFFSLVFLCIGYAISLNLIGAFLSRCLYKFLNIILLTYERFIYLILFPTFLFSSLIKKVTAPIIMVIYEKYQTIKFKRLEKIKRRQIEKILFKENLLSDFSFIRQ